MLKLTNRALLNATKVGPRSFVPMVVVGSQRLYHKSTVVENDLIIGGLVVAGGAVTLQYALQAWKNFQANRPPPKPEDDAKDAKDAKAEAREEAPKAADKKKTTASSSSSSSKAGPQPNASPFATWFARNFYDGGFEEKMTKREAALILGIRESATVERVKEAHRRILLLNHPDRGGSAFVAAKINEAKDLLLKGKQ